MIESPQTPPKAPRDILAGPRARLLELSQARGVSLAALSELLGRNPSYLQQFIRKGSPRKLEEQDRATLARFLGVGEEELRDAQENSYVEPPRRRESGEWVEVPRLDLGASAGPGRVAGGEGAFDTFQPQVVLQAANAIERLLRLPFASWPTGASGGQMSFNLGS
jgi:transcriptional regulator with XRE-family HTH domain